MDELLEILKSVRPDVDFENEEALIDDGILQSFEIISIVNQMNDTFDIEITVTHLKPENFNSVEAMWAMIERLQ